MHRLILAICAIVSLLAAGMLWWRFPDATGALAFCWRMGAVLAAAWLAYDDVQRLPAWLLLALPALIIVLVRWPKFLMLLLPVLIGLAVVRRLMTSNR